MNKGVIEWQAGGRWSEDVETIEDRILWLLQNRRWAYTARRYREGKRAVMLWPEERMGEVVELGPRLGKNWGKP